MSQPYGYAGQPPYQQQAGYYPQGSNPYQSGPQPPPPAGWAPQGGQPAYMPMPPPHIPPTGGNDAYVESGVDKSNFGFDTASIRAAFIRKVFILVSIMLTVVTIMTAIPFMSDDTMRFVRSSPALYWISYVTFFVVYLTLMCCESVRRSFPTNLIATGILTLAIGYMTMMICSFNNIISVLLCLIITAVCCIGIIIFASQTKYDLTSMMGIMFILSMVLLVFGMVAVISAVAFHVRWMYTVYAGIAALIFMVYLAIDIQMIMGGKKYEISPEDHIFAAIQIFLDIVYIFWMLLSLFGSNKD
uniref:Fas apoptotic inhibitory molecule 2 n=1 Tax=Ascaris suum TaxID=6253 RepID=F1L1V3_ASCSU